MPLTRDHFQNPALDKDDSYLGKSRASKVLLNRGKWRSSPEEQGALADLSNDWYGGACTGPDSTKQRFALFGKLFYEETCLDSIKMEWQEGMDVTCGCYHISNTFGNQKLPYKNPAHLAQQQEPWCRLSSTPTITSMKRDVCFFYSEIPKDDLDFRLAALYNHHTGTFKNKCEILTHQETIQDTHGANIRHWINPKKESIHSIQGSIVSPHTAAANGGYSRKSDGGFFST